MSDVEVYRPAEYFMIRIHHPLAPAYAVPAVFVPGLDVQAIKAMAPAVRTAFTRNLADEAIIKLEHVKGRVEILLGDAPQGFEVEVETRNYLVLAREPDEEGETIDGNDMVMLGPWFKP